MSVEIKDHRKFLEKKLKEAEESEAAEAAKPHLLEQVEVAKETGDSRLDKLVRAVAAQIEKDDAHLQAVARKGMENMNPQGDRIMQSEYMFVKGRLSAFAEVCKIPERIILEERGQ